MMMDEPDGLGHSIFLQRCRTTGLACWASSAVFMAGCSRPEQWLKSALIMNVVHLGGNCKKGKWGKRAALCAMSHVKIEHG